MSDIQREKDLLDEVARLAGRINRHKTQQKVKERKLLDDVSKLAGRINRHKQLLEAHPEIEKRGLKRSREEQKHSDANGSQGQFLCNISLS
jgi:hypothetical protein